MENEVNLLTSFDFARAIGVSPATVKRWDDNGTLKAYLVTPGGIRRYHPSQVDEYFAKYRNNVAEG